MISVLLCYSTQYCRGYLSARQLPQRTARNPVSILIVRDCFIVKSLGHIRGPSNYKVVSVNSSFLLTYLGTNCKMKNRLTQKLKQDRACITDTVKISKDLNASLTGPKGRLDVASERRPCCPTACSMV